MAIVTRAVRQKQARDAQHEREMRAMKRDRDMVEVPFERLTSQTPKAVRFPTYGWVPVEAIRWRQAGTGAILPWSCGRERDALLIAREFVR